VEEPELDDAPLTFVEGVEPGGHECPVVDLGISRFVGAELLREVVVRPFVERRLQRARGVRVHGVQGVDRLFLLDPGRGRELGDRRRPAELGRQLVEDAGEPKAELLEASGHVHRPRLVAEVPADLPDDGRHRIAREVDAAIDVEPVDRLDEADRSDLNEILERLAAPGIPQRERADERHELDERLVPGGLVAVPVVGDQQGVDVFVHDAGHLRGLHG